MRENPTGCSAGSVVLSWWNLSCFLTQCNYWFCWWSFAALRVCMAHKQVLDGEYSFPAEICSWMHGKFSLFVFSIRTAKVWVCWFVSLPGAVNQQAVIKDVKELLHFPVQSLIYWSISNYLAAESYIFYFSSPLWSRTEDQRHCMQGLSVLLSESISPGYLWLFPFPLPDQNLFHSTTPDLDFSIPWLLLLFSFCFQKKKKKVFNAVYPRKHFEHSVIKLGGNPSLPLCLLASNHINMKWGCFWVLTQCHRSKHSHKYFQDVALNQDGGWGKATSVLERNSFLLQPLSKLLWHLAINTQKLLYPQDHFSCQ